MVQSLRSNAIAQRLLKFRSRGATGTDAPQRITVTLTSIEPCETQNPFEKFRCFVIVEPSNRESTEIFGRDPISTLIAAISAICSYCEGLSQMGELRLDTGEPYDSDIDGVKGLCKRFKLYDEFALATFGNKNTDSS